MSESSQWKFPQKLVSQLKLTHQQLCNGCMCKILHRAGYFLLNRRKVFDQARILVLRFEARSPHAIRDWRPTPQESFNLTGQMPGIKRNRAQQAAHEAAPSKQLANAAGASCGSQPPSVKRARVEDEEDDGCLSTSLVALLWSKVLVKVGDASSWLKFEPAFDLSAALEMDTSGLLKALKRDKILSGGFEGVRLGACTLHVLHGALAPGQVEPTEAAEADDSNFVKLEAGMTLRAAAKEAKCEGERIFIRVRLPGDAAAAAAAPAVMHPQWQAHAARLKAERARFSKEAVPMLHRPTAAIAGKAAAARLGMTTLLEDGDSKAVRVGVFTMPGVPADIIDGPKGEFACLGS